MRRNQKLLSLFTLICFMFTLLPLAAFAAEVDYQQCEVFTDDTSVRTNEDVAIVFNFDGQLNKAEVTTPDVYVWFVKKDSNVPSSSVTSTNGYSKDSIGVFKIPSRDIAEGKKYNFQFINTGNYMVEASLNDPANVSGSISQKISNVDRKLTTITKDIGVDTSSSSSEYKIVLDGREYANGAAISLSGLIANNVDQEIKMKVIDANRRSVSNVKVRVESNSDNLSFDKTSDFTDQLGQVTFRVSTGRTGDYKIYVTCSSAQGTTDNQAPTDSKTENKIKAVMMTINSKEFTVGNAKKILDVPPTIKDNRTFVPYRALAEAFGAEVKFDKSTQSITTKLNDTTVIMTVGSTSYTVNKVKKTADVAPYIVDGRTMVPIRIFTEAFGSTVTPTYNDKGVTTDIVFNM